MPNKILIQSLDDVPAQICFADFAGDFNPTVTNDLREGTDTEVQLALLDTEDGAAKQSAKADLGAHFAERYACIAAIEMQVQAAVAGETIEFYWSASASATAARGNMGGAGGVATDYDGYSADLADAVKQLIFIGQLVMTDDAIDSLQIGYVGDLYPPTRFGSLVVKNEAGQRLCDTDDIETHVVLNPIIPEIQ